MVENVMEKLVALAKRRGFIFPGSELYGGLANTYDYGPVGTELLVNIRNLWWEKFVRQRDDMVGLDASLISPAKVWGASGHTSGFSDAMIDCKNCKVRLRADHLIEDWFEKDARRVSEREKRGEMGGSVAVVKTEKGIILSTEDKEERIKKVEGLDVSELSTIIKQKNILCPACGRHDWTEVRKFNLLFPVKLGIVEGDQSLAYLRGETAQGTFINFQNVVNSTRIKLPFGIAQLGKSFRNEITLGNSVFRTIEFEQGEIEYFFDEEDAKWEELFDEWKNVMWNFVTEDLNINKDNLRWREHADEERSFYSKKTEDLEYNYPFGFKELWGLAYRTNYDLSQHQKYSGQDLSLFDSKMNKKVLPHVIEPAVGINRLFLMVLCDAYTEEENRVVLKITPKLAPYKVAVFPLLANKEELVKKAREIYDILKKSIPTTFDDRGNIGKRYLYQDEIGTPWCVTVDFDSLEDGAVTVRDRDTTKQERVKVEELKNYFEERLK